MGWRGGEGGVRRGNRVGKGGELALTDGIVVLVRPVRITRFVALDGTNTARLCAWPALSSKFYHSILSTLVVAVVTPRLARERG